MHRVQHLAGTGWLQPSYRGSGTGQYQIRKGTLLWNAQQDDSAREPPKKKNKTAKKAGHVLCSKQ